MSETPNKVNEIKRTPAQMIGDGAALSDLLASGASPDDLISAIRQHAEDTNRAAQAELATPPAMADTDWQARRAWLMDGQPIYGELKTFFWPALTALVADDQAEYSRQRDLLFKALRTFLGDPPPVIEAPIEVSQS